MLRAQVYLFSSSWTILIPDREMISGDGVHGAGPSVPQLRYAQSMPNTGG